MAFRSATVRRERTVFYDSRGTSGVVGGLGLTFYPGQPQQANRRVPIRRLTPLVNSGSSQNSSGGSTLTQQKVRNSYLQQVLLAENLTSDLTNGVGQLRQTESCVEPLIVQTGEPDFEGSTVTIPVVYASPAPTTDRAVLFRPGYATTIRSTSFVQTGASSANVIFPYSAAYPTGTYTLRIMREANPLSCFSVRPGAVVFLP